MSSLAQSGGMKRVAPLGLTNKPLTVPTSSAFHVRDAEKEGLVNFVQSFASRVINQGFPVTHLSPPEAIGPHVEWDHDAAVLLMNESLTHFYLHSKSKWKVSPVDVTLITDIIVGEAVLDEVQGLNHYPASLLKRLVMIKICKSPPRKVVFVCSSSGDLQQIVAALSLFRLVPGTDGPQQITRRRVPASTFPIWGEQSASPFPPALRGIVKTSDDISTQIEPSGSLVSFSTSSNLSPAVSSPVSILPRRFERTGSDESMPEASVIALPSPSPRMNVLVQDAIPSRSQTQSGVTRSIVSPQEKSLMTPRLSFKPQSFQSVGEVDWCCSPLRVVPVFEREKAPAENAISQDNAPAPSLPDVSPNAPVCDRFPELSLPVDGYVTVKKSRREAEFRVTDFQVRIRDARRHPYDKDTTKIKNALGLKNNPETGYVSHTPDATRRLKEIVVLEDVPLTVCSSGHSIETATGTLSVASGVVQVDLLQGMPRKRQKQLAEAVYIPHIQPQVSSTLVKGTGSAVTYKESSAIINLTSNYRDIDRPGSRRFSMTPQVLDSSISPLMKERRHMKTEITLSDFEFTVKPKVAKIRPHDNSRQRRQGNRDSQNLLDTDQIYPRRKGQFTPRSERGSDTHDFTALFNKTELSESSWTPEISDGGEGTMTLLMAEKLEQLPGRNRSPRMGQHDAAVAAADDDAFSISASQLGQATQQHTSHLRLMSPLREDSGWQHRTSAHNQLSPLEKLKKAGHGLPTPFAQAAALRRSAEASIPTISGKLSYA